MTPLTSPQPVFVTSDDLERQIEQLKRTGEALSGLFGPNSLTWRVARETALLLGPGRALLLNSPIPGSPAPLPNIRAFSSTASADSTAPSASPSP
jgi:hypothetical protein